MPCKSALPPQSKAFAGLASFMRRSLSGLPIRAAANANSGTFVVPVNSAQGFRTLYRAESDFSRVEVQQPATPIYSLTVKITLPGGERPGLLDEWLLLIGLHY